MSENEYELDLKCNSVGCFNHGGALLKAYGFDLSLADIEIDATCPDCQKKEIAEGGEFEDLEELEEDYGAVVEILEKDEGWVITYASIKADEYFPRDY